MKANFLLSPGCSNSPWHYHRYFRTMSWAYFCFRFCSSKFLWPIRVGPQGYICNNACTKLFRWVTSQRGIRLDATHRSNVSFCADRLQKQVAINLQSETDRTTNWKILQKSIQEATSLKILLCCPLQCLTLKPNHIKMVAQPKLTSIVDTEKGRKAVSLLRPIHLF